jgi:carbamoylphosphate synthase large subunit
MGGNADEAWRGNVARSFVTSCCEGVHCAFVKFRVVLNCRRELSGSMSSGHVTGVGRKPFGALQKARNGLEFNNLARRLASFCQFKSSKVE